MNLESQKQPQNATKSSPARFIGTHHGALLIVLPLMLFLVTAARGTTLLDPQPEDGTTRFGQSVAVIGDITGDGVPDLVVGGAFHELEVCGTKGVGPPPEVGRGF